MTEFGEVNADLVSAPGLQATLEEADAAALEAAQDLVGGLGRAAAVAQHRHFLTIARAAADVSGDGALRRAQPAPDEGPVSALYVAPHGAGGGAAALDLPSGVVGKRCVARLSLGGLPSLLKKIKITII